MIIQQSSKITLAVGFVALMMIGLVPLSIARAASDTNSILDDKALVAALREGGFNLYFRHEATDWSQSDKVKKADDWLSCDGANMRQLSNAGRKSATATGQSIKSLGIPIGKIMASPYCRTVETARLMRLGSVEPTTEVVNLRISEYFGGRVAIISTAQALLAKMPAAGTNNLIVAHGNVAQAATPVYPGEGEGVVFKPDAQGGFLVVGRLRPEDWIRISAAVVE